MRITSEDGVSVVELVRNDPDDDYGDYTFRAFVKDRCCPFSGQNDSVHFSAYNQFLTSLKEFITTREGVAILEMTEDCRLVFFRWNARRDVGVRAQVSKYGFSTDSAQVAKASMEVEFKIDGEFVIQIYEEFVKERTALQSL
jgi:hypothetical protein